MSCNLQQSNAKERREEGDHKLRATWGDIIAGASRLELLKLGMNVGCRRLEALRHWIAVPRLDCQRLLSVQQYSLAYLWIVNLMALCALDAQHALDCIRMFDVVHSVASWIVLGLQYLTPFG